MVPGSVLPSSYPVRAERFMLSPHCFAFGHALAVVASSVFFRASAVVAVMTFGPRQGGYCRATHRRASDRVRKVRPPAS